jgi:dipeptidyl aminopeptidase/acylaminoacyl peptidase
MRCVRRSHTPWVPRSLALALAACLLAVSPSAQTKRPMSVVDLLEVPVLADPQLSNDGRHLLYMITRADWKADRRISHVWRSNADGTGAMQMTFSEGNELFPRWSPDGSQFAFLAARSDAPGLQVYLMSNRGGEPRVLSRHAGGVSASGVTWTPDGKSIFFMASDPKTDEENQLDRIRANAFAFEENLKPRHLWRISVADGAEQRITSGDLTILDYAVSPDGRRLTLDRAPSTLLDDGEKSEVWIMDADGKNAVQLTRNGVRERLAQLSPDGSRVLFVAGANGRLESYYHDALFSVPAAGGNSELVAPDFPYEVMRAQWAPDGSTIFVVANMGVHSEIMRIDLASRTFKALTDGQHSIPGAPNAWSINAAASVHVFMIDEPTRWGDVWTMPIAGGTPKRITDVFGFLDRDYKLPRQEKVEWKGADGVVVEGLMFLPADYEPGRRYPLIVQPHGGPEESDKFSFPGITYYPQVLAGKGYVVLKPNYRGSTGYGSAFMRDMVGGFFKNSHLDVLAGADALIAKGIADPQRVALMGFSAGAHITNKLITMTDRFKAASSFAGVSNWLSMYSQSDTRVRRAEWFGGTPYQKDAPWNTYLDQSPLKDAWKVKTPVLFFVGSDDVRVPRHQAIEMFRAVKANGVLTHLQVLPNEGHDLAQPRHWLFKSNSELEWFEKHLMNRAYEHERAPGDPAPKKAVSQ